MHPLMLKEVIEVCKQRSREGDCPTVKPFSVEQLEDAVVQLAHESDTIQQSTLANLAEALRKVCPGIIPTITLAHAEYNRKVAARDEAFESLLAALRPPENPPVADVAGLSNHVR